jgi:hypothetical protein
MVSASRDDGQSSPIRSNKEIDMGNFENRDRESAKNEPSRKDDKSVSGRQGQEGQDPKSQGQPGQGKPGQADREGKKNALGSESGRVGRSSKGYAEREGSTEPGSGSKGKKDASQGTGRSSSENESEESE